MHVKMTRRAILRTLVFCAVEVSKLRERGCVFFNEIFLGKN